MADDFALAPVPLAGVLVLSEHSGQGLVLGRKEKKGRNPFTLFCRVVDTKFVISVPLDPRMSDGGHLTRSGIDPEECRQLLSQADRVDVRHGFSIAWQPVGCPARSDIGAPCEEPVLPSQVSDAPQKLFVNLFPCRRLGTAGRGTLNPAREDSGCSMNLSSNSTAAALVLAVAARR